MFISKVGVKQFENVVVRQGAIAGTGNVPKERTTDQGRLINAVLVCRG